MASWGEGYRVFGFGGEVGRAVGSGGGWVMWFVVVSRGCDGDGGGRGGVMVEACR